MQVDFYRIGGSPVARVLARIAARVLAARGRLLIVTGDAAQAAAIDEALWTDAPDSFLPHGRATAEDPGDDQPILIATGCVTANGARNVALVDGVWRDAALAFDRAFHLFDDGTIEAARLAWRGLATHADVTRHFWAQDAAGKWDEVA